MTEDRYEIRSKIGEGGVGAVYRAFDKHLNREVAIKRVLAGGAGEDREDATGSMLKEAASLSSLQHPHIVTIYDSGTDKDGPYVVMELLSGRTIDEMVERGILTYEDFREVALQSQEALIAAQDLDLVHRDIKPSNLMITWLPSGRFHTKLVDFGLAKFQAMPSHQTVDHGDSVFGSIRFMAPEQFERTPLDKRTDMYSMGCVYYYCLTGQYPFDGETAPQVMTSHLQGKVIPLHGLRPDLPSWLCDWVMWHMSRNMDDRPADARNSLTHFLMGENNAKNDTGYVPSISNQSGAVPQIPLTNPDGRSGSPGYTTAPQPIQPPEGHSPSIHTAAQTVQPAPAPQARLVIPGANAPSPAAPAASTQTAPQPAYAPPVHGNTTGVQQVAATPRPPAPAPQMTVPLAGAAAPAPAQPAYQPQGQKPMSSNVGIGSTVATPKKGLSNAVKVMIAATLLAAIIISAVVFKGKSDQSDWIDRRNAIVANFKDLEKPPTEIPMTGEDVGRLLRDLSSAKQRDDNERELYFRALSIAKATDGSDISQMVANYAKDVDMESALREKLFRVTGRRGDPSALPALIAYASKTDDTTSGRAALTAASTMATTSNFQSLLAIIANSPNGSIKASAVGILSKVISSSEDPSTFATPIIASYKTVAEPDSSAALLRLMGSAGGNEAADIVADKLESDDENMKVAAALALRDWPDDSQFEAFLDYTKSETNDRLRKNAFEGLVDFLKVCPGLDDDDRSLYWNDVAVIATGEIEQRYVINAMAEQDQLWADDILDYFIENSDSDRVQAMAEKAKDRIADNIRRAERNGNSKKDDKEKKEPAEDE